MFLGWFWWCLVLSLYCMQLPLLAIISTSVQWVLNCLLVAFEDKELLAEQGDAAASSLSESVPLPCSWNSPLEHLFCVALAPLTTGGTKQFEAGSGAQEHPSSCQVSFLLAVACNDVPHQGRSRATWLSCSLFACCGVTNKLDAVL